MITKTSLLAFVTVLLCACQPIYDYLGGRFKFEPENFDRDASPLAEKLVRLAKAGVVGDETGPVDHHFHIVGLGTGIRALCAKMNWPLLNPTEADIENADRRERIGVWLNPDYFSIWHPGRFFRRKIMLSAADVRDEEKVDEQYLNRVLTLAHYSGLKATYFLYAMDWRYDKGAKEDDPPNWRRSDYYVSNRYVIELANCLNRDKKKSGGAEFVPVASVHPYRPGAKDEIRRLAAAGVRFVKWLPPAQNIDPSDKAHIPFYDVMAANCVVLLSHTGVEHTVRVEDQDLGNPTRLRLPLKRNVTVVMLHSGREGKEPRNGGVRVSYFERFIQMMKNPDYEGQLFGEISAVPYAGTHKKLKKIFGEPVTAGRIVDGTDYPNPAIALIKPTAKLLKKGYLTWKDDKDPRDAERRAEALDEIYNYNPLLFDFVLKRTIRIDRKPLPVETFESVREKAAHLRKCD